MSEDNKETDEQATEQEFHEFTFDIDERITLFSLVANENKNSAIAFGRVIERLQGNPEEGQMLAMVSEKQASANFEIQKAVVQTFLHTAIEDSVKLTPSLILVLRQFLNGSLEYLIHVEEKLAKDGRVDEAVKAKETFDFVTELRKKVSYDGIEADEEEIEKQYLDAKKEQEAQEGGLIIPSTKSVNPTSGGIIIP